MTGFPAAYFCVKAFSETDLTEDLKKIDVPTLILHRHRRSDCANRQLRSLSAMIVKKATLKVYNGAPHGLCTTHKQQVNEDLLAFLNT